MRYFVGIRDRLGTQVLVREEDGRERVLDPGRSLAVENHSPTGFDWGYAGSGPAQLALALLLESGLAQEEALCLHQAFKFAVVSKLRKSGWLLTTEKIRDWARGFPTRQKD